MALLVDGAWCGVSDLLPYDVIATTVAQEEGIDLDAKLRLSEEAIWSQVSAFLEWERGATGANSEPGIENAVVDERLRRWHINNTLAALYRDASFSQVNDRFEKKQQAFAQDAAELKREYFQHGVGWVRNPVRRPSAPTLTVIPGQQAAAAYTAAATRVSSLEIESALSDVTAVQAPSGSGLQVSVDGLATGEGWNVYLADASGTLRRQNTAPLGAGANWTLPNTGVAAGAEASRGQEPTAYLRARRILPRG